MAVFTHLWRVNIPPAPELPVIKIAFLNIAKWLEDELPAIEFLEDYEDEVADDYTDPDKESLNRAWTSSTGSTKRDR